MPGSLAQILRTDSSSWGAARIAHTLYPLQGSDSEQRRAALQQAIEAKVTAVQQALEAENALQRVEFEAKQQVARARAEAEGSAWRRTSQDEPKRYASVDPCPPLLTPVDAGAFFTSGPAR